MSFLDEIPELSEAAMAMARGVALASLRVERYERREMAGKDVDDEVITRLLGGISRAVVALCAMKPKPSDQPRGRRCHVN